MGGSRYNSIFQIQNKKITRPLFFINGRMKEKILCEQLITCVLAQPHRFILPFLFQIGSVTVLLAVLRILISIFFANVENQQTSKKKYFV